MTARIWRPRLLDLPLFWRELDKSWKSTRDGKEDFILVSNAEKERLNHDNIFLCSVSL